MKNNPGKKYNRFYRHIFLCNDAKCLVYFDQNRLYIIEIQVQLCISAFLMHASISMGEHRITIAQVIFDTFPTSNHTFDKSHLRFQLHRLLLMSQRLIKKYIIKH